MRYRYKYKGPVLEFDRLLCTNWAAETIAESEMRARSNLKYQFRTQAKRAKYAKITLPGKLTIVEAVMD